ncbi:MAG: DUF362 domain-containing protein, partial [Spirochaetales bacterium]|nr:DUF362 domain-containing protein [Spirochaetales bacterium]
IARTVTECDFLINVPVLKAHSQTKLTCSLKNIKGVMPEPMKPRFHTVDLHRAIAQLNSLVRQDFILVDGGFGDLSSELGGTPVELGIMAAGFDPLEIDAFAAGVLGFRPEEILHLGHYARWRGVDPAGLQPEVRQLNKPAETKSFTVDTDPFSRYPCGVISEGVCCTCRANLAFALRRLSESGDLRKNQFFLNGRRGMETVSSDDGKNLLLAVGNCAAAQASGLAGGKSLMPVVTIEGCPPSTDAIIHAVRKAGV